MGEATCPYNVLDVAQLLQSRYAFVSGGKAKNGAAILSFPDCSQHPDISDDDYKKIVTYLCCVPPLLDTELGFVVVIDKRQDGWGAVKTMLLRISVFFPKHIQVVFLLQPKGFFQRAFADFRSKFVKEELEFKVVMCGDTTEMLEYIDPDQLTADFGGTLEFDAIEWTQHRSAVEKFSSNTEKVATLLSTVIKKLQETELPNDVGATEKLLHDNILQRRELLEDLSSSTTHGETLLGCIKGDNSENPIAQLTHVLGLERLLVQLEETRNKFEEFWASHERRLKQGLQLRKFEEEFKLFQFGAQSRLDWLESKMSEMGETLSEVDSLITEFNDFEQKGLKEAEEGEIMRSTGEQLIMDDHYAIDSIRPKCVELQRICDQYRQLLRRRRELLTRSHDLQDRIDRANRWCNQGVDLLANQHIDKCHTQHGAERSMKDIETFVNTARELKLNNPKEFRALFESMITPDTRAVVQKVLKRIEDVQGMCEKRRDSLKKITMKCPRPVQHVHPEPAHHTDPDSDLKRKMVADMSRGSSVTLEKSARLRIDDQRNPRPYLGSSTSSSLSDSLDGDKNRMSYSSMSTSSSVDTETLLAKQKHVLNELIETEKTYVTELHDILIGYYYQMVNRSMQHLVPNELAGRRDVLFGNLEQIYSFHNDVFLEELGNCKDAPSKIGKCFVNRKVEFQMYSNYCQNKPRSDSLRTQIGDTHPFFKECQRKLGHKLPLGAYLLKPVQRITKYQLLLKEMLKFADNDTMCKTLLQEAHDTILDVLKYVNDSMLQVSIVGLEGNLSEHGRLLKQGCFNMWTEHKLKIKDIRFKAMQRQVFLYERAMILCKKKEDITNTENIYSFKNLLKLSQVGLTENIKGDKKRFELWLRGREEVYIFQAPNLAVKENWIKEIKKVLQNQFEQLRVNQLNLIQKDEEYLDEMDDSCRQHSSKSNPTIPVGLEMMSPESPPDDPEEDGWSSGEFSDSDDEIKQDHLSPVEPSYLQQFIALGDYDAVDEVEVSLREGDILEVLRTGSSGWWLARNLVTNEEGWVPATYLEPILKKNSNSHSHFSVSSIDSSGQPSHMTSHSSVMSGYSISSPSEETTV